MADFPALPMWTDAYLADTRHLSTVQHGAYFLLLMEAWRRPDTALPDDDALLARLAGLSPLDWANAKPVIMAFWKIDLRTKTWSQKRLTNEKIYVKKKSRKQRSAAKSRWNKGKEPSHGNAQAHARGMPDRSQTDAPTPTPTPKPMLKEDRKSADANSVSLESQLRAAAGWQNEPAPMLAVTGPIESLIAAGASLEQDVLPVLIALGGQVRSRTSWKYFMKPIAQARDDRLAGLTVVSTPRGGNSKGNDYGRRADRKGTTELAITALSRWADEGGETAGNDSTGDRAHPAPKPKRRGSH